MSHRELKQQRENHKMLKQAERAHEFRRLAELVERLKRQLKEREKARGPDVASPKPPIAALDGKSRFSCLPSGSWFQES